jgi:hypothetical protein
VVLLVLYLLDELLGFNCPLNATLFEYGSCTSTYNTVLTLEFMYVQCIVLGTSAGRYPHASQTLNT